MLNEQSETYNAKNTVFPTLSLLTSLSTLVCCAMPALLVTIGAGASLAGLLAAAPWLVTLSKYKVWIFGISGIVIMLAGIMQWRSRNAPCPSDPEQAKACNRLRRFSQWVYGLSVLAWCVGFFFAFLAVELLL